MTSSNRECSRRIIFFMDARIRMPRKTTTLPGFEPGVLCQYFDGRAIKSSEHTPCPLGHRVRCINVFRGGALICALLLFSGSALVTRNASPCSCCHSTNVRAVSAGLVQNAPAPPNNKNNKAPSSPRALRIRMRKRPRADLNRDRWIQSPEC